MVGRLKTDVHKIYDNIMIDYIRRDFIEGIIDIDNTVGHFIPHHPVYKDSTTTPIHIVYDCSYKANSQPSLNDCLNTGPKLINDLVEILVRFRCHNVGFVSDIEKAFLNIQLDSTDRDYTRFFGLSDPDDPDSTFDVNRFKAILFGSVSSPFILNSVVKHLLEEKHSSITEDLQTNIYVDNIVSGTNSESEAISYYKSAVATLQEGGFNLRSWSSNNSNLRALSTHDNKHDDNISIKVLGMMWHTDSDTLTLRPTQPPHLDIHVGS